MDKKKIVDCEVRQSSTREMKVKMQVRHQQQFVTVSIDQFDLKLINVDR